MGCVYVTQITNKRCLVKAVKFFATLAIVVHLMGHINIWQPLYSSISRGVDRPLHQLTLFSIAGWFSYTLLSIFWT